MNIHQAIETRYVGPTNTRGSRVIATNAAKSVRHIHHWDYALSVTANHYAAAEALRAKLDWPAIVAGGSTARGFAFVTSTLDMSRHMHEVFNPPRKPKDKRNMIHTALSFLAVSLAGAAVIVLAIVIGG
jgi:hypothetical protein